MLASRSWSTRRPACPSAENADIVLYHAPQSRAFRMLWFLEELGRPYRIETVDLNKGDHKKPYFLALNPMGKVPTLIDQGAPDRGDRRDDGASRRQIRAGRAWLLSSRSRAAPTI